MNRDIFRGIWQQSRGKVKETWGVMIDDSRLAAAGSLDRHAGRTLQQRGLLKQESERQLSEFLIRNRDWRDPSAHR